MVIAAMKLKGKLELVKQEIAKVNIDILGISELKWTGMGEFNSNDQSTGVSASTSVLPMNIIWEPVMLDP